MKFRDGLPSLRREPLARLVVSVLSTAKDRLGVRLVHFSVQANHVHLIVEVDGPRALSRAMQGLATRLAHRVNSRLARRGRVFADRYHARALRTPLEVRRALVYVLHNHRHHQTGVGRPILFDPLSTAAHFVGFTPQLSRLSHRRVARDAEAPVARARTWLLRVGWRRHGLLSMRDVPS
ncbi:MAG TPA: transposase [Polyangiaceae bacterium]|nr:transposase [Polyangiaceae bacterium]